MNWRIVAAVPFVLASTVAACGDDGAAPGDGSGGSGDGSGEGSDNTRPELPPCSDNFDCRGGEVCREGLCREACVEDADCGGLLPVCDSVERICVECLIDDSCPAGEICVDSWCDDACSGPADCGGGQICTESGVCVSGDCTEDSDCRGGFRCRNNFCESIETQICDPSSSRCTGVTSLERCSRDGTDLSTEICDAGDICVEVEEIGADCREVLCSPNEMGCVDSGTAYSCDVTGTERNEFECDSDEYCDFGECRVAQCEPSTVQCDGGSIVTCDDAGRIESAVQCATTTACLESANGCSCDDAECVERLCRPGTQRCAGPGYQVCAEDGLSWSTPVACSGDDVCFAGECLSSSCAPNSSVCIGDSVVTCNSAGTSRTEQNCTLEDEVCAEFGDGVACQRRRCVPDSARCGEDVTSVYVCDSRGATETAVACGDGSICDDGICVAAACTPGSAPTCRAGDAYECSADGASFVLVDDCTDEEVCRGGACVARACVPSSRDCVGDLLVECTADGTSARETDCAASDSYCDPGALACVRRICDPGTAPFCDGSDVVRCNDDGSATEYLTTCADGCSDGACLGVSCPVLEAFCVASGGGVSASDLTTIPLNTIYCATTLAPGAVVDGYTFNWTLTSVPDLSLARATSTGTTTMQFYADMVGTYGGQLRVSGGAAACDTFPVVVRAIPVDDVYIELAWTAPGDTNESDTSGTDVDIYLRNSSGCWTSNTASCHYAAKSPDWGPTGALGNPELVRDDLDGRGPEVIRFNSPDPVSYFVGVHYFNDNAFGAATARVRIYLDGTLLRELSQRLTDKQFWTAGTLNMVSRTFSASTAVAADVPSTCP